MIDCIIVEQSVLGIVPIACEQLFEQIDKKKSDGSGVEYQVTISMLEIYCEKVRDLLSSKAGPKGGLKLREHPKKGFYGILGQKAYRRG